MSVSHLKPKFLSNVKTTSFSEWADAGFPIYTLCTVYDGWSQPKGMWLPDGFSSWTELESAFWAYAKKNGFATCATCGKRPTVYRRFTPPPSCMMPNPVVTEQPGLFISVLGEVIVGGYHWIRNIYGCPGSLGAKFELKPAKSGITLKCCENSIQLDTASRVLESVAPMAPVNAAVSESVAPMAPVEAAVPESVAPVPHDDAAVPESVAPMAPVAATELTGECNVGRQPSCYRKHSIPCTIQ
jgi:hypothetical protein